MVTLLNSKIYKKILKIDRVIRIGLDRILPRNLTVRYIAALIVVATLAVLGQLFVQSSLVRQSKDQKKLRVLESQIHDSETFRKTVLSLQLNSRKQKTKSQMDFVESFVEQFQKNKEELESLKIISKSNEIPTGEQSSIQVRLTQSLQKLIEDCRGLSGSLLSRQTQPIHMIVSDLLKSQTHYRTALKELSQLYDQKLEDQISEIKRTEFLLLLTTLMVLILEALYVFRPGVEGLYGALKIRSDFLGRMGHEMRNPMNSILGMAHLLFETPLTEQQKKYLSILQKSSTGLLEVLNNLLDFSSVESGTLKMEKTPFDFYKLLERSIDLAVYGAHANGIELVLDLDSKVPLRLNGDPVRLQQILTNLLGNAVKFTKKGEVILKIRLLKRTDQETLIQFSVVDTGMGIDRKKMSRIFDAFVQEDSTVRRRFGGTGLGLTISRDLVELLGGTLAVDSQKGKGSRFYFTLPFSVIQELSVEQKMLHQNLRDYEVVVAEPNFAIAEVLSRLIQESGGSANVVDSSDALIQALSPRLEKPESKKLVLVDYEFSKDFLPHLFVRMSRSGLKIDSFIFLIKTTASSKDIEKLAEYGIRNFIFKPVKPFQLLESLGQGLAFFKKEAHPSTQVSQAVQEGSRAAMPAILNNHLIHDPRPLRVLAVDDSKDNQFLVKAYLSSLPYKITFADNGKLAVEKFKLGTFDIVLMDLQMPEMDGYTAIETIRDWERFENIKPTPVVAISAHDKEAGSLRFLNSQFSSYLVKPISPNQLRQTILNFTQKTRLSDLTPQGSATHEDQAIADLERQLAELGPAYLKNRKQELNDLKKYLSDLEFDKIQTLGHRLKGNAKSYGFEELGILGAQLESAAMDFDAVKTELLIRQTENYIHSRDQKLT